MNGVLRPSRWTKSPKASRKFFPKPFLYRIKRCALLCDAKDEVAAAAEIFVRKFDQGRQRDTQNNNKTQLQRLWAHELVRQHRLKSYLKSESGIAKQLRSRSNKTYYYRLKPLILLGCEPLYHDIKKKLRARVFWSFTLRIQKTWTVWSRGVQRQHRVIFTQYELG